MEKMSLTQKWYSSKAKSRNQKTKMTKKSLRMMMALQKLIHPQVLDKVLLTKARKVEGQTSKERNRDGKTKRLTVTWLKSTWLTKLTIRWLSATPENRRLTYAIKTRAASMVHRQLGTTVKTTITQLIFKLRLQMLARPMIQMPVEPLGK